MLICFMDNPVNYSKTNLPSGPENTILNVKSRDGRGIVEGQLEKSRSRENKLGTTRERWERCYTFILCSFIATELKEKIRKWIEEKKKSKAKGKG